MEDSEPLAVPERQTVSSGTAWEAKYGYTRAVRVGRHVHVSGTTATDSRGEIVGEGDAHEQAQHIFTIITEALQKLGSSLTDVVRTRTYVVDILANGDKVGKAHGEVFKDIRPAATMVEVSGLIAPGLLVEIEVDATLP
ncbi:MAG: RidA family protein [Bacteroidetes bacterium]|nr:RidA family protein [Bacteroidota bacterium]